MCNVDDKLLLFLFAVLEPVDMTILSTIGGQNRGIEILSSAPVNMAVPKVPSILY